MINPFLTHQYFFMKKFIFIALIFGFFSINSASAMTLDEFSALSATKEDFGALFHAYVPFTQDGYDFWDYAITPLNNYDNGDYGVIFYNANGAYTLGDGTGTVIGTTSQNKAYAMNHDGTNESNYLYSVGSLSFCNNSNICESGDRYVEFDMPSYSSQDIIFLDSCSSGWQSANYTDPYEYKMCGSWNPTCSPVYSASTFCGGGEPSAPPVGSTCTAPFSNVPSILDDPLGWITSIWDGIANWFSCLFQQSLDYISGLFSGLNFNFSWDGVSDIITNALSSVFIPNPAFLDEQFANFQTEFTTQFADVFTFYDSIKNADADTYETHLSGSFEYKNHAIPFTVSPFQNIPSYVPTITSFVAYLSLAWFLIHKLPELFG